LKDIIPLAAFTNDKKSGPMGIMIKEIILNIVPADKTNKKYLSIFSNGFNNLKTLNLIYFDIFHYNLIIY